jgi:hypothetical protein
MVCRIFSQVSSGTLRLRTTYLEILVLPFSSKRAASIAPPGTLHWFEATGQRVRHVLAEGPIRVGSAQTTLAGWLMASGVPRHVQDLPAHGPPFEWCGRCFAGPAPEIPRGGRLANRPAGNPARQRPPRNTAITYNLVYCVDMLIFNISRPPAPFGSSTRTTRAAAKSVFARGQGHLDRPRLRRRRLCRLLVVRRIDQPDDLRKRGRPQTQVQFLDTRVQSTGEHRVASWSRRVLFWRCNSARRTSRSLIWCPRRSIWFLYQT